MDKLFCDKVCFVGVKCVPLHPLSGTKPGGDKREFFEHDEIDRKDSSTRAAVRVAGFPVFAFGRVRQEPSNPARRCRAAGGMKRRPVDRIRPCHKMVRPGRDRFYNVEFDPGSG